MTAHRLTRLSLAAALATAAFVLFSPSLASATVICEEKPTGTPAQCPAGNYLGKGSFIFATAKDAVFTGPVDVKCKQSDTELEVTNAGGKGKDASVEIKYLNFAECADTSEIFASCSVTAKNLPYSGPVKWASGTFDGTIGVLTGTGGNPGVQVVCDSVKCTYGSSEMWLEIIGGQPVILNAEGIELDYESGGFLCGGGAGLDAFYEGTGATTRHFLADNGEGETAVTITPVTTTTFNVKDVKEFTVKNVAGKTIEILTEEIVPGGGTGFEFTGATCLGSLAANATCTRKIECKTAVAGHYRVYPNGILPTTLGLRCD